MVNIERLQQLSGIIGNSSAIQQVIEMITQVAEVDISVLITGESGTGKEMVAKALHKFSKRSNEPMVTVNCGAIPSGLIESELFGHKKGAYTGAAEDRQGYFKFAHKGTIFLDEIGETPLETQVKLLRVLESGEFMRVGDSKMMYSDVRVITATNSDLETEARKGNFRQDLYYRLKTVTINVPALRQRIEDLSLLVERFALQFTRSNDIPYRGFMPEATRLMKQYDWPGNVRELKNFVESILVLEKGQRITVDMIARQLRPVKIPVNPNLPILVDRSPEQAEREILLRQVFLMRQDIQDMKEIIGGKTVLNPIDEIQYLPHAATEIQPVPDSMNGENFPMIRGEAIGDMTLEALEKEAIMRTLQHFNNNRRAAARSLGMSERTLYRKIDQYGLERKIKGRS
ncbi:MAG: sigma-54-dependent Fis family transcriptional regulator [Candidatus Marinimicrobia bacterium]|nr:sigma-54-dependent Fis family transcriptional regulator [Candidatus Neomarinimicrobiota bacterium]